MRLRSWAFVLLIGACGVASAEVRVGDVREAQSRAGTPVRAEPKALASVVATLPYRTRVTVQEVRGYFAKVATDSGTTGWVRTSDIVMPGALTGPGGQTTAAGAARTSSDVSAAGRQFDEETERQYRVNRAELEAAYAQLDAVEKRSHAPGDPEVLLFVSEGRLGR
jgi:hypothetical protein